MCDHSPNREAAMVVTHRKADGTPRVWCDPCIAPIIRALNDGGLPTAASCCGHGNRVGRISLADGRELFLVPDFEAATTAHDLLVCHSQSRPTDQLNPYRPTLAADEGDGR